MPVFERYAEYYCIRAPFLRTSSAESLPLRDEDRHEVESSCSAEAVAGVVVPLWRCHVLHRRHGSAYALKDLCEL